APRAFRKSVTVSASSRCSSVMAIDMDTAPLAHWPVRQFLAAAAGDTDPAADDPDSFARYVKILRTAAVSACRGCPQSCHPAAVSKSAIPDSMPQASVAISGVLA